MYNVKAMKNNIQVKFPLYSNRDDDIRSLIFSKRQQETIREVKEKIRKGKYKLEEIDCLCGNKDTSNIVIGRDRYGFDFPNVLCPHCGIVRAQYMFDQESLEEFYKREYRRIYVWRDVSEEEDIKELFRKQKKRGEEYLEKFKELNIDLSRIKNVCEVGSASGGILLPFQDINKDVVGCDFEQDYLDYGKERGLDLRFGDIKSINIDDNSQDLVILSHVLEHLIYPIKELNTIIGKIKTEGYLLVEVPSVLNVYANPLSYFQNAHVYNFAQKNLEALFKQMGLDIIYSDELCLFIVSKPKKWTPIREDIEIYNKGLKNQANLVEEELKSKYLKWEICNKVVRDKSSLEKKLEEKERVLTETEQQKGTLLEEKRRLENNLAGIAEDNEELKKKISSLDRDLAITRNQNDSIKKSLKVVVEENRNLEKRVNVLQSGKWYLFGKTLRQYKVYNYLRKIFNSFKKSS
jgi:2-polyprenyl-3-methyl-5-hydroxy-6-metoxy-1,4-benzoquinol methylase